MAAFAPMGRIKFKPGPSSSTNLISEDTAFSHGISSLTIYVIQMHIYKYTYTNIFIYRVTCIYIYIFIYRLHITPPPPPHQPKKAQSNSDLTPRLCGEDIPPKRICGAVALRRLEGGASSTVSVSGLTLRKGAGIGTLAWTGERGGGGGVLFLGGGGLEKCKRQFIPFWCLHGNARLAKCSVGSLES